LGKAFGAVFRLSWRHASDNPIHASAPSGGREN
jgi:hypothetical protein